MKITKTITGALAVAILTASLSAVADRDDRRDWGRRDGRGGWHGDIRYFHERDFDRWRGGRWTHGYHDGRLGWWWVVAGLWYFYPRPIYPYPDPYTPSVVIVQPTVPAPVPSAPPPVQYWYYCDAARAYYPYVPSCPTGWRMVPATPSGAPGP